MDNVPHLSGYDRERVCVPQFCDCDHQDCRYKRFLKRCDADRYVFQICNHNLLLADASTAVRANDPFSRSIASSS